MGQGRTARRSGASRESAADPGWTRAAPGFLSGHQGPQRTETGRGAGPGKCRPLRHHHARAGQGACRFPRGDTGAKPGADVCRGGPRPASHQGRARHRRGVGTGEPRLRQPCARDQPACQLSARSRRPPYSPRGCDPRPSHLGRRRPPPPASDGSLRPAARPGACTGPAQRPRPVRSPREQRLH